MKEEAEIIFYNANEAGVEIQEFGTPAFVCVDLDFGHIKAKLYFNNKKEVEDFIRLLTERLKNCEVIP